MKALFLLAACSASPLAQPLPPRTPSTGVAPVGWINPRPALLCESSTRLTYVYPEWVCL
jgi:hypothetical protein